MQTPKPRPRRTFNRFATVLAAFALVGVLAATFFYIDGRSANVIYYSKASLPPELITSWSTQRDGLGAPPPNFTGGDTFVIQNTHNMTTAAAWSVSGANSKVQIESGGTLTATQAVTVATATTFQIDDGGTYIHNNTAAPTTTTFQGTESFATTSNFEIRNFSTAAIPVVTGGFGNLTINVATLGGSWNQTSNITNVKGNFTIQATGGGSLEFRLANGTDYTLNIGGNLTISGGILNISNGSSAAKVINIGGNFNQTGGTFTSGTGTTTINFTGGTSFVNFTKSAGTLTPTNINWSIANGKTVQFNNAFTNAASRTFNIDTGGLLLAAATITNNGTLNVNGDFRLTDGGFATGTDFTYGANGILSFTTAGGYNVNGTPVYWPATNGPRNVNVIFGGITLSVARTVGGLFQYSSGVSGAGNLTLNGTSQVNTGGFVSGSPTYGAASLLRYNTGGNYGRNGEWLPGATSGAGYPANVQLSNNTTLDLPNGSTGSPFQSGATLTIDNGSSLNMAGSTPLTQPLNVLGSLNLNGNLTLSTSTGGDLRLGGNWTRAATGTFTHNNRAAIFNGAGAQAVTVTGGGSQDFAYLVVDKPSGNLTQNNGAGFQTSISVSATVGNVLSIVNAGGLDLNGQSFFLSNPGGNVFVSGGARSIVSNAAAFFNVNGAKTVTSAAGGTLSFGNAITVSLNSGSIDFGANLSTVNGVLAIFNGAAVVNNAPTYGAGSTLIYATGTLYGRGAEWTATTASTFPAPGYPDIVNVSNAGTILDMGANGGTATPFAANGTLGISSGATFSLAQTPMTVPVTFKGDVSNNGTLVLSTALGGDIKTHGSFIRFVPGVFTHNNRAVFFEGAATQNITDLSGAINIPYVVINKTAGSVQLNGTDLSALAPAGGSALTFQTATSRLAVNSHTLTVGGTFGSTPIGGGLITSPSSSLVFVDGGTTGDMGALPTFNIPNITNLTVNRTGASGSVTLSDASVSGTLALTAGTLRLSVQSTTLSLGPSANVTRGTGYVLGGIVQKSFGVNPDFTFPVGTANGYSPVDANSTTGAGQLSVSVQQQGLAVVSPINSLQRYWSLDGSGITTNLTFHYLDGDVNVTAPVTEADYKVVKFNSTTPTTPPSQTVDAANNKATVNGVSSFSNWTLAADSAVYGQLEFTFGNTNIAEGDSGSQVANVIVRRAGGGGRGAVSIDYAITDGTANAGSDYTATGGTLNWAADDFADKQISVNINGDTASEPDETINLTLSNPQGGAVAGAPTTATITITNDDSAAPTPSVVYVDDDFNGANGTDPDGGGPATSIGYDAFATIQGGIDGVAANGTVNVAAGNYEEDVNVNKTLSLLGAGAATTNIRGPIGGPATTVFVTGGNSTVAGFTITRVGNNTTDWNNPGLNSVGVAMQGQAITGVLIRDNVITGNRTGLDINNTNGHTIRNNVIDFNRTGFIFRNQTDNETVVENFITNNWTVGILFLEASGGTNSPVQSAAHSTFSNNNISANWYGQIVDRQSGGSVPAPATTNYKNFIGNWYGTTSPVITTANSAEPGYAAQIPVAYGGTATPPGGQPDIAGPASANFKYTPFLQSGTDTNVETTPGRGTNGFQGVPNTIVVSPPNMNGWAFFDDNPGVGVGTGGFEDGPATPPLGTGSAFLQVDDTARHALGTFAYAGTRFDDLSELQYSSYQNNSSNPAYAPSLQFDIDYDLTDTTNPYQGRLVFEPYQTGSVQQNVWQNWDALAGNWYGTRATVPVGNVNVSNPCQQATPCTRQQILALFPNAGIRNTALSALLFKAGGPWPPSFRGNVDAFKLSVGSAHVTYDFEPAPQLSIDDVTHAEGNSGTTDYTFTVTLSRASDQTVTVDYATADDTATVAGNDYAAIPTTQLSFAPGETTKQFTVTVNGDTLFESNEQFFVNLSNVSAAATILDGQGTGTITNDDGAPAISISDATVAEPDTAGTSNATFTVSLSNPSSASVTVDYQTADGTATAPDDYNAVAATTLTFAPGETQKFVNVSVKADALAEGAETFSVNLSNPTGGATIADGTGAGTITDPTAGGQVLISEFRFRGPAYNAGGGVDGSRDEFVELYNNTSEPITVGASDGSAGWSIAAIASDGATIIPLATIPAGTVIAARGHYLVAYSETPVNPATGGYSLGGYAVPDLLYLNNHIADDAGVALFRTANAANFTPANRLDAAGFNAHAGATADMFREGAGLVSPGANDGEYAFVRKLTSGLPQDTGDNAADFTFVSTDGGAYGGVQSILGAPGPEDSGKPVQRNSVVKASLVDGTALSTAPPNRVRSGQVQPGVPNAYGTLSIQRRFKNTTPLPITRLRFRVVDITTRSSPVAGSPQADLRVLSSTGVVTNSQGQEVISVTGLTLETPPVQTNGGGLNSTLTVILPGNMLASGNSIDVQFLLGVEQQGNFRFLVNVEALPGTTSASPPSSVQSNTKNKSTKMPVKTKGQ